MYDFLIKKGQMVAFIVGVLLVVAHIVASLGGNYNIGLVGSYFLAGIAAAAMLFGVIKFFIENPNQIKIALGFIGLFVVLGVLVMVASGDIPSALANSAADKGITPGVYKYISGAINGTLLLLGLGVLGLVVSEVLSLLKS